MYTSAFINIIIVTNKKSIVAGPLWGIEKRRLTKEKPDDLLVEQWKSRSGVAAHTKVPCFNCSIVRF